jgi:hypothetical protein
MTAIFDGAWVRSVSTFALVAAFEASTACPWSMKSCNSCVNAFTVKVAPPTLSSALSFG